MKKIISFAGSILFLMSCNYSPQSTLPVLDLEEALMQTSANSYQKNIKIDAYIPLETNDESLITGIRKIAKSDDYIFILDTLGTLNVFNTQGKFLRKIGQRGQGPGEYTVLTDFAVDTKNKTVYINSVDRLLSYDFEGNFKRDVFIHKNSNLQVFTFCNNKFFYIFPDMPYPDNIKSAPIVTMIDINGKTEKEFAAHQLRRGEGFPFFNNITSYDGNVFYKEEMGQILYMIGKDLTVSSLCRLNFGKYAFKPEDFDFSKNKTWKKHYRLQNILPGKDFMILILQKGLMGQSLEAFIWNRKNNTVFRFNPKITHEKEDFTILPFAIADNKIAGVLIPTEDNFTEDNPILTIMELTMDNC